MITLLLLLCCWIASGKVLLATLYLKDGKYSVQDGVLDYKNGLMFATYEDSYESVGWDFLTINSTKRNDLYNDEEISYGYGYLEAFITYRRIWDTYLNSRFISFNNVSQLLPKSCVEFLKKQKEYIMSKDKTDPYWAHAQNTYDLVNGLYDGYKAAQTDESKQFPSYWEIFLVVSMGDLLDVMSLLPDSKKLIRDEFLSKNHRGVDVNNIMNSHCSGFVNYSPESDDFYFAHVTWAWYEMNIRIFKKISLHFSNPLVKSVTTAFSSYPAMSISGDDFYVTDQNLFVFETTLSCYNDSLHSTGMTPLSLLTWQRAYISNHFADSAETWAKVFSLQNSGTYNDEFVILDGNLAQHRTVTTNDDGSVTLHLPEKTVVAIDQIPQHMFLMDVTDYFISIGNYFPGYNIPYSKEAYNLCEIPEYIKKHPDQAYMLDYDNCVRALMFKRDHTKVNSVDSMKSLIRYNNYKVDPLSKGNPAYAIASRWDLQPEPATHCGGGLDGKVVSLKEWMDEKAIHIIASPTYDDCPVFEWDNGPEVCKKTFHEGVNDKWNYEWMKVNVEI